MQVAITRDQNTGQNCTVNWLVNPHCENNLLKYDGEIYLNTYQQYLPHAEEYETKIATYLLTSTHESNLDRKYVFPYVPFWIGSTLCVIVISMTEGERWTDSQRRVSRSHKTDSSR